MTMKKRCLYCGEAFYPDPRTAEFQKSCPKVQCRKIRKRQADLHWNRRNPDYFKWRRIKVGIWAKQYPNYWRHYRSTHPAYKNRERERMRERRALRVAKQDTITQNPVGYLSGLRSLRCQTVAKQDAIDSQIDGILDYLILGAGVAKPNDMAPGGTSAVR